MLRDIWKQLRNRQSALPVLVKLERRPIKLCATALGHAGFAIVLSQFRFVVESIHVRRPALHAEEDNALRPRGKMRCPCCQRIVAIGGSSSGREALESEPAKARG